MKIYTAAATHNTTKMPSVYSQKQLENFACASAVLLTSVVYQRGFQGRGVLPVPTAVLFFSYFYWKE